VSTRDWARVKRVVAQALDLPAHEREAFVQRACDADAPLLDEVRSLLAAAGEGDSLPGARAVASLARDVVAAEDEELRAVLERALAPQYELVRSLGRGGMGAVFLARERSLERMVAVKVLRPDLAASPESRERFRREARVAAQLSHPGIVPLYAFGEAGADPHGVAPGLWWFVMGYVAGEPLAERLRLRGRLPHEEATRLLRQLAEALDHAHAQGVVHRDLKPANVLLDDAGGRAVLADFGISKMRGDDGLTLTGVVVGTPSWMSPEQAAGLAVVDERSDLYSLGAVGWAMLTGREPPREEATVAALRALAPDVPPAVAEVVVRCLAHDPARRPPSARALADALAGAAGDLPHLPEGLRDLPGFGPYAITWAIAWSVLAAVAFEGRVERALLLLVALIVPLGLGLHVWLAGGHGLGASELARIALWPPEWWGMWWPRALRRPADLWPRLPAPARLVRTVLSVFLVALPALLLARRRLDAWPTRVETLAAALVSVAGLATGGALLWAARRGLGLADAVRLLLGSTVSGEAWRAPRLAALLLSPRRTVRDPDADMPDDHRRAIAELAPQLAAEHATLGREAAAAAGALCASLSRLDAELASLARDADDAELERLEARLASLEATAAVGDDDRRRLRDAVRTELDVVRGLRARREVMAAHRARQLELLRGLWWRLTRLHAGEGDADSLRALCAEARRDQ
jgi:hypothetical protein